MGAGNDSNLFFVFCVLFFVGGSLSPPRLNIFTVGNMGVMMCLGQGGLRSLSASSVFGSIGLFVCLFVCLSVCGQHYSKGYERIGMKFYGGVLGSTMKN